MQCDARRDVVFSAVEVENMSGQDLQSVLTVKISGYCRCRDSLTHWQFEFNLICLFLDNTVRNFFTCLQVTDNI